MLPKLSYNVFFQNHTDDAIKELSADTRRTLRATLRTVDSPPPDAFLQQKDSFLRGWDDVQEVSRLIFDTQPASLQQSSLSSSCRFRPSLS